jgi:hypothetical protein
MAEIELRRKTGPNLWVVLDDEDVALVANYHWYASIRSRIAYAVSTVTTDGKKRTVLMHRIITGWPMVDHIDHDGLNNVRANLRPTTHTLNNANVRKRLSPTSSRFKGVYWSKDCKKWRAVIRFEGKSVLLGFYVDEDAAGLAYDLAATKYYGEHANLNFRTVA